MNLKTMTATGLLLGGAGIFAVAQNQTVSFGGATQRSVSATALAPVLFGQTTDSAPSAPSVSGLFGRVNETWKNLGAETHLTSSLRLRVKPAADTQNRNGKIEILADEEPIRSFEVSADKLGKDHDIDLDLTHLANRGTKSLKARFRVNDKVVSQPSTDEVKISIVTVGTPPVVDGLLIGTELKAVGPVLPKSSDTIKVRINYSNASPKNNGGKILVELNGTMIAAETISEDNLKTDAANIRSGNAVKDITLNPAVLRQFANRGAYTIRAKWETDDTTNRPVSMASESSIDLVLDTLGPQIEQVKLVGEPGTTNKLVVIFKDDDLDPSSVEVASKNFVITKNGSELPEITAIEYSRGREVRIPLSNLVTGRYELTVFGTPHKDKVGTTALEPVKDKVGNSLSDGSSNGKDQKFTFSSYPEPDVRTGQHIEFAEYTKRPPRKEKEVFNPGDKVETRVARLYYFRDAHRVAQIINRNVQSYNRAAVKMNERIAEDARETANTKTNERRTKERAAIRAAEASREEEHKLNETRNALEQSRAVYAQTIAQQQALDSEIEKYDVEQAPKDKVELSNIEKEITATEADISKLETDIKTLKADMIPESDSDKRKKQKDEINDRNTKLSAATATLKDLNVRKQRILKKSEQLQAQKTKLGENRATAQQTVRDAASKLSQQEQSVATRRNAEKTAQEATNVSEEAEDRAREQQFRAEVTAATTDPDTYVPGKEDSPDPVSQVSISVIGEGLIQLRGPIRGINKIRTMINQIDAPLGQVKVGIFTVQVNGEHGDRMEKVAGRIEGHIDLSRFLTNQSLAMLRRAIQEVGGMVVANVDAQHPGQHRQIDRDRKYLYAFFGRDFIDELYEMDSYFLRTENKLLSLHGMDTVSQSQACFIMALAKNDVRQQILDQFRQLITCELPQAEYDFRKTSGLLPCKLNSMKEIFKNANEKYKFRNVHGFFEASINSPDAMTPMQREFIRLSQIFKSQLVAEMELKQRVIERGMIEDAANSDDEKSRLLDTVHAQALQRLKQEYEDYVLNSNKDVSELVNNLQSNLIIEKGYANRAKNEAVKLLHSLKNSSNVVQTIMQVAQVDADKRTITFPPFVDPKQNEIADGIKKLQVFVHDAESSKLLRPRTKRAVYHSWDQVIVGFRDQLKKPIWDAIENALSEKQGHSRDSESSAMIPMIEHDMESADYLIGLVYNFGEMIGNPKTPIKGRDIEWESLKKELDKYAEPVNFHSDIYRYCGGAVRKLRSAENRILQAEAVANRVRRDLDHRKLLELLIDEQEEKYIELVEGTRAHISQVDTYLKRLAIAMEDDFKVQFYDPAFTGVREASREWDVNLGQVERTTILTNNRQLAKVSPQATMEFDLPKRAPMIVEGMNGARALVQEYGTLLQDPTFLSLAGMMSGTPAVGGAASNLAGGPNAGLRSAAVRTPLPGLPTDTSEQMMAQSGGPDRKFGTALEGLIPDPAVYKFETGTGFEIRPVIQPDGHSVIYDFDYMYTTNVREPVRPDEKHLGRVKRHFIHTQVQTASFELREISRYQVALKVSRTSRGVPLLEDIPGAGMLFRPLPSDESSLQQNIILGQSTVYPTLFDLMGLRWSKYVVDLDHIGLRDLDHSVRGREKSIRDFTFDEASTRVDEFLDIQNKQPDHLRRDFYHQQRTPSPYHPGGYHHQPEKGEEEIIDSGNRNFTIPDRRPEEYRNPAYDPLRRNPVDEGLRQYPTRGGMPEDVDLRLQPPEDVPPSNFPGQNFEDVPPSPAGMGAQRKPPTQPGLIQPAGFQAPAAAPRPLPKGVAPAPMPTSSIPSGPKPAAPVQKKSWLRKTAPANGK